MSKNKKISLTDLSYNFFTVCVYVFACAASLIFFCLGTVIGVNRGQESSPLAYILIGIACVVTVLLCIAGSLLAKKYTKSIESKNAAEMQSFILSHREKAAATATEKRILLKKIRGKAFAVACLFCVLAAVVAFSSGVVNAIEGKTLFFLLSVILFLFGFSRMRFATPKVVFQEDETYVLKKDYPAIYNLAEKAQKALGCVGELKIAILPDTNAGIAQIGNVISLQIGAMMLAMSDEQEVYSILLHEFGHLAYGEQSDFIENKHISWLRRGGNNLFLSKLFQMPYLDCDIKYFLEYELMKYASSVNTECKADEATNKFGDKKSAASALIKAQYYDFYKWCEQSQDCESMFKNEQPSQSVLKDEIDKFVKAVPENKSLWNELIGKEIIARSASHPTLKMRLDVLGITDYDIVKFPDAADSLRTDAQKAVNFSDELITKYNSENYAEQRNEYYIEPLNNITEWQSKGEPITAETYADIIADLRSLGNITKAIEVCDRVITTLPKASAANAYYIKGMYLLHKLNDQGIEYVYKAVDINSNYIEEGMETVGEYCCMTGNAQALDEYREKALVLTQEDMDKYSKINELCTDDNLSPEKGLPELLKDGLLQHINQVSEGKIETVYLVRKTVTDDFFTSAVIVKLQSCDAKTTNQIMHKLFCYLDSAEIDWQFSLFSFNNLNNGVKAVIKKMPDCVFYEQKK